MNIMQTIKKAMDIADYLKDAELKAAMLSLTEEVLDLQREKLDLRTKLLTLEEIEQNKKGLEFNGNAYWKVEGDKKDGPFCSGCWDKSKTLARLQSGHFHGGIENYKCPVCDKLVSVSHNS